tara:strand:+ start:217 stop:1275 length:1059 start_codon:yes stop_codon:yes gene_type:complete
VAKKKIKEKSKFNGVLILIVIVVIIAFISVYFLDSKKPTEIVDTIMRNGEEIKIASDGTKFIIDPSKISRGGPRKGGIGVNKGIPALDENNIRFVSVSEADKWIEDNELVLAIQYKGIERVYPLQIMVYHEIANDIIAGDPILITYCPLAGAGIAYDPTIEVEGKEIISKFGTSGKLFNSDLIMYDQVTDTYWQQIGGKAIIGNLTGQELKKLNIDTVVWGDWKLTHKNSEVLSRDIGMNKNYERDPYGNYYEESFLMFNVENTDDRVHSKTVIFGIEVDNEYSAYRESDLIEKPIIEDVVAGVNIKVQRDKDGVVRITNLDTNEEIIKERDFWFAWYAFHPDTKLYGVEGN